MWTKKTKGNAKIYTSDVSDRAIVANPYGISWNGNGYASVEDAKRAAEQSGLVLPIVTNKNVPDPVLGDDGSQLVVFHGTDKDFETFDMALAREKAIFFSADAQEAYKFASEGGYVIEANLLMGNPLVVEGGTLPMHHGHEDIQRVIAEARAGGHDGIFIRGFRDMQRREVDTWIALAPDRVRVVRRRHASDVRNEGLSLDWR